MLAGAVVGGLQMVDLQDKAWVVCVVSSRWKAASRRGYLRWFFSEQFARCAPYYLVRDCVDLTGFVHSLRLSEAHSFIFALLASLVEKKFSRVD